MQTKEPKVIDMLSERIMLTEEFITRNNLKLRSQEEILAKIKKCSEEESFMDFRPEVLIGHLNFENAKQFLKDEYVAKIDSGEKKHEYVSDLQETAQDFLDYMNFAWMKALDERGLSASRSINKLSAWLWLMGREDLEQTINDDTLYNPYGSPALIEVCNKLEIAIPNEVIEFSKHKCQ